MSMLDYLAPSLEHNTLGRAVMVAIAVGTPLEHKDGGTHGRVMVFIAIMDVVFKGFERASKVWSRY
jgi:hypothetical protein